MERRRLASRFALLMCVIGGHSALILLWLDDRLTLRRIESADRRSTLVIVPAPAVMHVEPATRETAPSEPRHRREALPPPVPSAPMDRSIHPPPIDWHAEGTDAAKRMAPQLDRSGDPKCKNPSMPALVPPECRPRDHRPEWTPQPAKVGVQGLLPYVRVGKHCLVGLGFFACGIGDPPAADGHALDDMRDPDRPSSSVPDNAADR